MSGILVVRGAADTDVIRTALPDTPVHESPDLRTPLPAGVTVLVLRSGIRLGERELDGLPCLRHVVRTGSGTDHIDMNALKRRGIALHRNAEIAAGAVGEWVLTAALALARRIPLGHHALLLGRHEKEACMGVPLRRLAVGIWGTGPVGLAAARALAPHVARAAYAAWPSNPPGLPELPGTALIGQAQVHVIALPLRDATRKFIGEEFLARVGPQRPLLICAGRLETLDIAACLSALEDGVLSGLALDPVERENLPLLTGAEAPLNLLASPHIGAQRADVRGELDQWAIDLLKGDHHPRRFADRRRPPVNASAQLRREIAGRVARDLIASGKAREVWLEGALACGFAHSASDIDLRGVVDGEPPQWESRVVDGVRVDLGVGSPQRIEDLRRLLRRFDVHRDDLGSFRRVRAAMHDLMCLRTAVRFEPEGWQPVLDGGERQGYRRWAVAHQAEIAASLAEDLTGLVQDRLAEPVRIVCRKLESCLTALECAAAGHPVLGDKWLPLLADASGTPSSPSLNLARADTWEWFRPVQRRVTRALLACWPVGESPEEPPGLDAPHEGWLPQRYADGWFLRRGDVHLPITAGQLLGWLSAVSTEPA